MDQQQYVDALLRDLEHSMQQYPRRITSIFMGGGTPSLFAAEQMQRLLTQIKANYAVSDDCEITCEANPGAIDAEQFAGYFAAGINRLSIGVQSFNDNYLKKIGRIHSADQAHLAIERAVAAGFKRINIDIMYALPEQSLEDAMRDLRIACATDATHLSWYQLTFEPDTYFAKFPPKRADADLIADMEQAGLEILKQNGLHRYEISAYHKANDGPCQHNLNYWLFGDYHAIGAGAHGKITASNTVIRYHKPKVPKIYLAAPTKSNMQVIPDQDLLLEYMLNTLRLFRPINLHHASQCSKLPINTILDKLAEPIAQGLLVATADVVCPTQLGYLHLNNLLTTII